MSDRRSSTDRESPVGEPVVRADADLFEEEAVPFDPDDPESLADAAETVRAFAVEPHVADAKYVLRGAAACAALVRGEGGYRAAVERAGEAVSVSFVRKWARVHDLPYAVRRHVACGDVPPTAAKHVARVQGRARYLLAWAVVDAGMTVREVRDAASAVADGTAAEAALREHGVDPGTIEVDLPVDLYVELRRRAALSGERTDDLVAAALRGRFDGHQDRSDASRR
ncbi:MAG: hypothetical protein V5A23_00375 [Halobacteriales archaeon]